MDSYAIIDWLEDAYPDRPSSYLPTATSASPDALAARATGTADLDAFRNKIASFQLPFSFSAFALCKNTRSPAQVPCASRGPS